MEIVKSTPLEDIYPNVYFTAEKNNTGNLEIKAICGVDHRRCTSNENKKDKYTYSAIGQLIFIQDLTSAFALSCSRCGRNTKK